MALNTTTDREALCREAIEIVWKMQHALYKKDALEFDLRALALKNLMERSS